MDKGRYNEEDFPMFVSQLLECNRIEGAAADIAKYFLDYGYESLSDKQKVIFDESIEENYISACNRCSIDIPWCEMLEATDNGGYCNYCQHMMEKDEEDDAKFDLHEISGSTINMVNETCIRTAPQVGESKSDSSVNISYTFLGVCHNHKFTEKEIEAAYQESINK